MKHLQSTWCSGILGKPLVRHTVLLPTRTGMRPFCITGRQRDRVEADLARYLTTDPAGEPPVSVRVTIAQGRTVERPKVEKESAGAPVGCRAAWRSPTKPPQQAGHGVALLSCTNRRRSAGNAFDTAS